jgi:DNA-binding Lrp family transcriptional regulator
LKSFLLVKVKPQAEKLMEVFKGMPEVRETHLITGKFDILLTLDTADHNNIDPRRDVAHTVLSKIRALPGVTDTRTIVPIDSKTGPTPPVTRPTAKGFVFIDCASGKTEKLMTAVLAVPEVHATHMLFGKTDLLAEVEVEKSFVNPPANHISSIVQSAISKLPGVRDTDTIVPIESYVK